MSQLDRRVAAAMRHHQAREYDVAAEVCREVLAKQPSNADANHLLGVILSQRGDQASAVRPLMRALKANPANPYFHNSMGNALHKQGRNKEAIASFRQALAIAPAYAEAWSNLGLALHGTSELAHAIDAFRRAIALAPRSPLPHNNLGNALAANGDLDAALASFDIAIACDPRYHEAYSNRGNTLKLQGREADALASYDSAIALEPNDLSAVNNRAVLQLQRGEHASALPSLELTAAAHPHDAATVTHLGVAYAGLGRFGQAMHCFDAVLERDPKHAGAHYYRGHVKRATGFPDEAIGDYLGAIECDPGYAEAFDGIAFTLLDTLRFDELEEIVEGIVVEGRLPPAHCGGMRVIRAISRWLRDETDACALDIDAACAAVDTEQRFPNAAMIGIYRQFLRLLLAYRHGHRELYAGAAEHDLHIVGESHCLSAAWTIVPVAGIAHRVVPHLVMGAKAWHFAAPQWNDHKHNLRRILDQLPAASMVVFVFGEIDTRIDDGILRHIKRHPDTDLETLALNTVSGYVDYVVALARTRGITPIFQGVPAPGIDYSGVAPDVRERHLYTVRFVNAALSTLARQHGCTFIDVFAPSASGDGTAHGSAHVDAYHLTPVYLRRALEATACADNLIGA